MIVAVIFLFSVRKEAVDTESMAEEIIESLNVDTMFTIPVFGGLSITESIVVMWIVMAVIIVACLLLTRNLKVENPGKVQVALEWFVMKLYGFFHGLVGKKGECYIPYFMCLITFIGVADMFPMLGFKPPTKDLNVTLALAVMSIVLVEIAGIRAHGPKGWLKGFTKPVAIVTPMNILEIFIKPFSLCMRLMGNMLGGFAIMELLKLAVPIGAPAIASLYFDVFDGILQAFVFVFLTALYVQEAIEDEEEPAAQGPQGETGEISKSKNRRKIRGKRTDEKLVTIARTAKQTVTGK